MTRTASGDGPDGGHGAGRPGVGPDDVGRSGEVGVPGWDVVVAGGGGAGLSAALMLGRARRRVLVVDGGQPRNRFAAHLHGLLGHDGIDPRHLLDRGRQEVARYGVEVIDGRVADVIDGRVADVVGGRAGSESQGLVITLDDGRSLTCRALVVATGITDELPDVPGLAQRWGTSVLHCPYCHGWEVADQRLGVIATSATALHQVQLVRQWSDRVVLFAAGAGGLDEATVDRLTARGIQIVDSPVVEVVGDGDRVAGVRTGDGATVAVDALFVASEAKPHDRFLAGLDLARTDSPSGSLLTVDPFGATSHPLVWAAGNVVNPMLTVPMAVSAGAMVGAVVNMTLVTDEFEQAVREREEVRR